MAKKSPKRADPLETPSSTDSVQKQSFVTEKGAVDPSLALLFASSAGPVKPPLKTRYQGDSSSTKRSTIRADAGCRLKNEAEFLDEDDEELSSIDGNLEDVNTASASGDIISEHLTEVINPVLANTYGTKVQPRKRKRQKIEDDLEGNYLLRISKEEEKEEEVRQTERRLKRQKVNPEHDPDMLEGEDNMKEQREDKQISDVSGAAQVNVRPLDVPQHETVALDKVETGLEKSSRTVFLANVSTLAITDKKAKKTLLEHMGSFLDSLPVQEGKKKHKIESIRFRSTAYDGNSLPKKASFAKQNLKEATTKGTNAYVVYSTPFAAREAAKKLNGTVVLERHLRVDSVAHPAKTDHRRCVFVGNLGFVDDESMMEQGGENERKRSKIPSDVEEGLWRQFSKVGTVESVRVVRDEKTRVGKGFAYVQFQDANAVEAALLFHDKKFPPMLPRVLRVTRAKAVKKTALASQNARSSVRPLVKRPGAPSRDSIYNPKLTTQEQSQQGRARKLLGKAGAAQFKRGNEIASQDKHPIKKFEGLVKTPENIVFEGYRASPKSGKPKDLKLGRSGGGKRRDKPRTRNIKRGSELKKGGKNTK